LEKAGCTQSACDEDIQNAAHVRRYGEGGLFAVADPRKSSRPRHVLAESMMAMSYA
jgi:hypothetical protein